jgi:hypothetical protein
MGRCLGVLVCVLGLAAADLACKSEIESPSPRVTGLTPSLACGEQLTTEVRLAGGNLSPVARDVLTEQPALALPDLWLQRTADLSGAEVAGSPIDLGRAAPERVRWLSQAEMLFDVFPELELEPGLYDLYVSNADGPRALLAAGLVIVPRPTLGTVEPVIACGEQIDNVFRLTGSTFLVVDGRRPRVDIGGVLRDPDTVEGCVALPGPTPAQACTALTVTLPAGSLAPGIAELVVTNPEPAGCLTTERVEVEIVPPPSVAAIEPALACVAEAERLFTVRGSGFLVLDQHGDEAWPTAVVGDLEVAVRAADGCTPLSGPAAGRRCTELTVAVPEGSLEPGLQAVVVTNPEPAHCVSVEDVALEVVPPPSLVSVAPALICNEQGADELVLTGSGFIVSPGAGNAPDALPSIAFGEALVVVAGGASDCETLPGTTSALSCGELSVTVPEGALAAGLYDLAVTNPDPAGCTSTQSVRLEVIPAPIVAAIEPALTCLAQSGRGYVVSGEGFLVVEGAGADGFPTVTVGDATAEVLSATDCTALSGAVSGRRCETLSIVLAEASLEPDLHAVVVTNPPPAACQSQQRIELEVVAPPSLTAIEPILACVEDSERLFVLSGAGFIVLEEAGEGGAEVFPEVRFGEAAAWVVGYDDGCRALSGTVAGRVCSELTVSLPAGVLAPGAHLVVVSNPDPAGCTSVEAVTLEVVPPAVVTSVDPVLLCGFGDNQITVSGSGFLTFPDGAGGFLLPRYELGEAEGEVDGVGGCVERTDSDFGGQVCTELTLTVGAEAVEGGQYPLVIINPPPADCASTEPVALEVLRDPIVTGLEPAGLCVEFADTVVRVVGRGFLSLGDSVADWPTVRFGSLQATVTGLSDCQPLAGTAAGQRCGVIETLVLSGGASPYGDVEVVNPVIAACETATVVAGLEEAPPPTITGFEPSPVCDDTLTFDVLGEGFQVGASVTLTSSATGDDVALASTRVVRGDPDRIEIELVAPLAEGTYSVSVTNPDSCGDARAHFIVVVTGPFLFNIDPPVAYSEIRTLLTLWVSGITDDVTGVWIVEDATGTRTDLSFSYDRVESPHFVFAEIPAGTLPAGAYTVFLDDATACPDFLAGALILESELTVAVDRVEPPFGWRLMDTAVDILALDPIPAGMVPFEDVPRVYLSPRDDEAGVASLVRSVDFRGDKRLTAVVRAGLPAGAYDVVVVNPSGAIGLVEELFWVTDDDAPPPRIDDVTPVRVSATSNTTLTITGGHFRDVAVSFDCLAPSASTPTRVSSPSFTVSGGGTVIEAVLPAASASLTEGNVCVVVVSQTSTAGAGLTVQTYDEFSAVAIVSPSGNLNSARSGPTLNVPRRGLSAAAGRATNAARYVYAIGGDAPLGGPAVYATVEAVALDRFGRFAEGWVEHERPVRVGLGDDAVVLPRTMAGTAQVGRFVYVIGGSDGATPVRTVLRAQVLDPSAAPDFAGLGLHLVESGGLGPGTWIYRISAVFGPGDPVNPGGETLPSEPIVVRLPDINPDDDGTGNDDNRVHLSLLWAPVERAVAYRVYRSPYPGAPSGTESLLAEVTELGFLDEGEGVDLAPDPPCRRGFGETCPRALGELGSWSVVASLPGVSEAEAARSAPCVRVGADPDDPDRFYVYVAGGRDANGTARATVTAIPVTRVSDDVQVVGSPWVLDSPLGVARWECGGFGVDDWVVFGPGRITTGTGPGSMTPRIEGGRIVGTFECDGRWEICLAGCGGNEACELGCDLALADCEEDFPPGTLVCGALDAANEPRLCDLTGAGALSNTAYGVASTGSFLFMFGGVLSSGNLEDRIFEAAVLGPPTLGSWTPSGAVRFPVGRRFPGSTQESGLIFMIGGEEAGGAVTGATLTTL